jgi:hypothetical protein
MSGTATPNLGLEYLDPSQAQPEVKINLAWDAIDAAVGAGIALEVSESGDSPAGNVKAARRIKFIGATVTEETDSTAVVTIESDGGGSDEHSSDSGGSPISVTDGTTTVENVTALHFTGATVTASGTVAQVAIAGGGSSSGSGSGSLVNINPDLHGILPSGNGVGPNDEFEFGTSIDLTGARYAGATPWSWVNQGTAAALIAEGSLVLTGQNASGTSHNLLTQPVSAASWEYTCKLSGTNIGATSEFGMIVGNSAGAFLTFNIYPSSGVEFLIQNFSSPTAYGGTTYLSSGNVPGAGGVMSEGYMQLLFDGTTIFFNFSPSGIPGSFETVFSTLAATFLGGAPTIVGLNINSTGTGAGALIGVFDWFRRTDGAAPASSESTLGANVTYLNANVTPDSHPASPTARDDEFEQTSLGSQWTWVNQGAAVATLKDGSIIFSGVADGSNHAIEEPISGPFTITAKVSIGASTIGSGTGIGLSLGNSSTGALYVFLFDSGGGPFACYAFSNPTTYSAAQFSTEGLSVGTINLGAWVYLRVVNDGTNLNFSASLTGMEGSFQPISSAVALSGFIGTVDRIGLVFNNNVAGALGIADWIRDYTAGYTPAIGMAEPVNVTPDTHPGSPDPANDEFEEGALDTGGTRSSGATPWALVNFSTATAALQMGCLDLVTDVNTTAARAPRLVLQALPVGAAWRYRAKLSMLLGTSNVGGMVVYESASGKLLAMGMFNATPDLAMLPYADLSSAPSAYDTVSLAGIEDGISLETDWRYFEFELASGNLICRYSRSGLDGSFATYSSNAIATYFTTAPDHIGLYGESVSATIATRTRADWFRRMA